MRCTRGNEAQNVDIFDQTASDTVFISGGFKEFGTVRQRSI